MLEIIKYENSCCRFRDSGRAQALNLRDSGYDVVIANREDNIDQKP